MPRNPKSMGIDTRDDKPDSAGIIHLSCTAYAAEQAADNTAMQSPATLFSLSRTAAGSPPALAAPAGPAFLRSHDTSRATPPRFSTVHASLRSEKRSRRKSTEKTKVKTEEDEERSVLLETDVPVPHDWRWKQRPKAEAESATQRARPRPRDRDTRD